MKFIVLRLLISPNDLLLRSDLSCQVINFSVYDSPAILLRIMLWNLCTREKSHFKYEGQFKQSRVNCVFRNFLEIRSIYLSISTVNIFYWHRPKSLEIDADFPKMERFFKCIHTVLIIISKRALVGHPTHFEITCKF